MVTQTIGEIIIIIFVFILLFFQYNFLVENENNKKYSIFENIINFIPFLPIFLMVFLLFFYLLIYLITKPFIKE